MLVSFVLHPINIGGPFPDLFIYLNLVEITILFCCYSIFMYSNTNFFVLDSCGW